MGWSINLGRIAGTTVRVHVTLLMLLAWIWLATYLSEGSAAAWDGLLFIAALFLCVLLHEFGHILAARGFGIGTPDVTLLPIGGVAQLERIPEEPRQELLIAIAGPLVNVAIALVLIALVGARPQVASLPSVEHVTIPLADRLAAANLFLAVFNIVPAFPMDGGRILRALLALRLGYLNATRVAAVIGQGFAFLLGFVGIFYNPMLIFIAIFVYLAAASEGQFASLRSISKGVPVATVMVTQFASLTPGTRIEEAIDTLLHTNQGDFPVVDDKGALAGLLNRTDMLRALKQRGLDSLVSELMTTTVPTVDRRQCLDDALRILQEKSAAAVGVTDDAGRLVGLITSELLAEIMMIGTLKPDFHFGSRNALSVARGPTRS